MTLPPAPGPADQPPVPGPTPVVPTPGTAVPSQPPAAAVPHPPASPTPPTVPGIARRVTEPLRWPAAAALLVGNGIFLLIGASDLIFVSGGWAGGFAARSNATFGTFVGLVSITLPLAAVLLATHVTPALPQARQILLAALGEYAASAFFGFITYLGAFADGLYGVRATFDGVIGRAVWLAFLTIAATAVYRVFRALYPPRPAQPPYSYGPSVYGQPYPGQPTYQPPAHRPGATPPATPGAGAPTNPGGAP